MFFKMTSCFKRPLLYNTFVHNYFVNYASISQNVCWMSDWRLSWRQMTNCPGYEGLSQCGVLPYFKFNKIDESDIWRSHNISIYAFFRYYFIGFLNNWRKKIWSKGIQQYSVLSILWGVRLGWGEFFLISYQSWTSKTIVWDIFSFTRWQTLLNIILTFGQENQIFVHMTFRIYLTLKRVTEYMRWFSFIKIYNDSWIGTVQITYISLIYNILHYLRWMLWVFWTLLNVILLENWHKISNLPFLLLRSKLAWKKF